jgi:hypothetical protein
VPNIRSILAQNVFFALSISIVPSLLPLLCFKVLKLGSLNLGLVFACMGIGSVTAAAAVLPRIRRGFSSNAIIRLATVLLVPALFLMAFGRVPEILFVAAGLAAAAWTIAGSELWVVGQRAMPRWARAPLGAVFVVTAQGAIVIGGVVWAFLGRELGITLAVALGMLGTALLLLSQFLLFRLPDDSGEEIDFEAAFAPEDPDSLVHIPYPRDGPITIALEFEIEDVSRKKFLRLLRSVRSIHLRNGAHDWCLLHDPKDRSNAYRVEVTVPSWSDFLLRQERLTIAEKQAIDEAWSFHIGNNRAETHELFCVSYKPHTIRHFVTRLSSMPEAPFSVD